MTYIHKFLRLKDPELIKRWRILVSYAVQVPRRPVHLVYKNVLDTSQVVTARRDRMGRHLVWFHVVSSDDMRTMNELKEGEKANPFFTDYKVSTRYPFILREVQAATLTVRDGTLALPEGAPRERLTLKKVFRRARMASRTGFFTPSVEELDALISYLEHAETHDTKED